MKGIYYTTADIKSLFGWSSDDTIARRQASGFLPSPDIPGRPNKWLKSNIDALIEDMITTPEKDEAQRFVFFYAVLITVLKVC